DDAPAQKSTQETSGATEGPYEDPRAPDEYTVKLETTEGPIVIDVHRAWAPRGADRFYALVKGGFYDDVAFFRVIEGFMAQVGMSGDPALTKKWSARKIKDDPVVESN